MKRYLCLFLMTFCCNFVQGQYVTIDGRQFKDENGNNFYPLVCNYNVNIMNLPTATDFSTSWVTPWQNYNDANSHCFDQAACNNLLISDFTEMVSLGFNALRIMNFHPIYFLKDYEIDKEHPGASDYWKCPETGFYIACGNTSSVPPVVYYNIKDKIIENHYFDLIINMFVNISQIELNNGINMKVILVTVEYPPFTMNYDPAFPSAYNGYLDDLSKYISNPTHYSNYPSGTYEAVQKSILGYDLQNEPFNTADLWPWGDGHYETPGYRKEDFCNDFSNYYSTIKKNEPHRLITLGGGGPFSVFNFDPEILALDFYSPHIYPKAYPYLQQNNGLLYSVTNGFEIQMNWLSNHVPMPIIIGETGFGASNGADPDGILVYGNEQQQKQYAAETIYKTYKCNGSGYSWWNYQDESPAPGIGPFWGALRHNGTPPTSNQSLEKPVNDVFRTYTPPLQCDCPVPNYYYDPLNNAYWAYVTPLINPSPPPPTILTGSVIDQYGAAIKDAYIEAWVPYARDPSNHNITYTITYTFSSKVDGSFRIIPFDYQQGDPDWNVVDEIFVSAPGYSRADAGALSNLQNGLTPPPTVQLYRTPEFNYSSTINNYTVSPGEDATLQAWNDLTLKDCLIMWGDDNCDIKARQTINIEPEFTSEYSSKTWIHTTPTFFPCEKLNFPANWDDKSTEYQPEDKESIIKEMQLNFLPVKDDINFKIYPNPSSGLVTIEISNSSNSELVSVDLIDVYSRKVYSTQFRGNIKEVDLSKFADGIYYITFGNSFYKHSQKIIIIK